MESNIEATTFYKHFKAVLVGIFQGLLGPRGRPQPVFWLLGQIFCARHEDEGGVRLAQLSLTSSRMDIQAYPCTI